ncbi:MAG: pseudouridine synthase, partial [Candidatus Omnitrophota bacterium]
MRLQVFLSHSGVCSRRKALTFIQTGKVTVNSKIILEPSCAVEPSCDCVCLCDQRVGAPEKIYILLNKPKGVVTTVRDRFAFKTVMDLLPKGTRNVFPVGRLDKDTTGLLLLTNDGVLAHRLMHPSFEIQKIYR